MLAQAPGLEEDLDCGLDREHRVLDSPRAAEEFTGPPWAVDWTKTASEYRDSLPQPVRDLIIDAVVELLSSRHPYGDHRLDTSKASIEPARSIQPLGPHVLNFDHNRGWLRHTFIRRAVDPQVIIEVVFWQ